MWCNKMPINANIKLIIISSGLNDAEEISIYIYISWRVQCNEGKTHNFVSTNWMEWTGHCVPLAFHVFFVMWTFYLFFYHKFDWCLCARKNTFIFSIFTIYYTWGALWYFYFYFRLAILSLLLFTCRIPISLCWLAPNPIHVPREMWEKIPLKKSQQRNILHWCPSMDVWHTIQIIWIDPHICKRKRWTKHLRRD